MKNKKTCTIVACVLCAVFLIAGSWMLVRNIRAINSYGSAISEAQQALTAADPANADGIVSDVAALQAQNVALEETLLALQAEAAEQAEENAQLQDQYDELVQLEDTTYYQTILQSLTEGMNRVEEYLNAVE